MASVEPGRRQIEQTRFVLIDQPPSLLGRGPILACNPERRTEFAGLPLDRRESFAMLRGDYCRNTALEYAGLFGGNLFQGVAQKVGVIDRNARDDGRQRTVYDIRCIEPPAKAHLEQKNIRWMTRKN